MEVLLRLLLLLLVVVLLLLALHFPDLVTEGDGLGSELFEECLTPYPAVSRLLLLVLLVGLRMERRDVHRHAAPRLVIAGDRRNAVIAAETLSLGAVCGDRGRTVGMSCPFGL
jgi:hypothetical protein